jgi:hypothetical protein
MQEIVQGIVCRVARVDGPSLAIEESQQMKNTIQNLPVNSICQPWFSVSSSYHSRALIQG